jgi:penicillin V acylase-like amidase (Ntn superfamily)
MLAPSAARPCTTFLATHAGQPVFGKNYDYSENAGLVVSNPRGLQKTALALSASDSPAVWTSKYGSLTFNQYGVVTSRTVRVEDRAAFGAEGVEFLFGEGVGTACG